MRIIFILTFTLLTLSLIAQKEDYIWLYGMDPLDTILPIRKIDTTYGRTQIHFDTEPPRVLMDTKRFTDFSRTNASICNQDGSLALYTNGQVIYDGQHRVVEDTINYGDDWEYNNLGNDTIAIPLGKLIIQAALILPKPGSQSDYYLFYEDYNRQTYEINKFLFSIVRKDNLGFYNLIVKDSLLLTDSLGLGCISACRHANGRDWWLVKGDYNARLNSYLLDDKGLHYQGKIAEKTDLLGRHVKFSHNGKYVAVLSGLDIGKNAQFLRVSEFDRCTGKTGKSAMVNFDSDLVESCLAFSPDDHYVYTSDGNNLYQYEIDPNTVLSYKRHVAKKDSYMEYVPQFDPPFCFPVNFSMAGNGPDGRIYVSSNWTYGRSLHVIDFPNELGTNCTVKQHSFKFPVGFFGTMPNFPNYRLGPLDGSSCDTLGLDNHPIAKYRYEPDDVNYKKLRFTDLSYFRPETWSWDFGDGSPTIAQKSSYHTYAADGTYRVCLTVSNENSSNTFCRDITIGVSSTDENENHPIDVNIFPNPVQDILLVTIGEYIPAHALIEFYSVMGQQVHTQRVYYGHNNVDMSALPSGTYAWRIVDRGVLVKSGEVVKI